MSNGSLLGARWRTLVLAAVAVGAASYALESAAQPRQTPGERAVEYRQALYTVLAGNFGPVIMMADGKLPMDGAEAQKRADRVAQLAQMLDEAFPAESNGVGRTQAKPEIWTDSAEFHKRLQALIDTTGALAVAAKGADPARLKAAAHDVAGACKDCHDKFRKK